MKSQTFGEKIKLARVENNYSLRFVGKAIGYSPSSLSKVEKNERSAPKRILSSLARVLNIEYEELVIKYLSESIFYEVRYFDYASKAIDLVKKRLKEEGKGTQYLKDRNDIINIINLYFRDKPIEKAWLFGSFARNTNISFDSDIDLLVQFNKNNKVSLFDIINIKNDLSEKTGREVDLVEIGTELKSLSNKIHAEKFLIYGKETQTK
jgi:predicted nucleotidyltransferase/DNA-binding XRE family transcriptional regulator